MTNSNKMILNFSGGEVDPSLYARTDIDVNKKSLKWMQNYMAQPQGTSSYRPGFRFSKMTRNNNYGRFIDFQFSDSQAYEIELTKGYMRFHKEDGVILKSADTTISGITQANPGVVTFTGEVPLEGEEIYIDGVVGMTEVNGRFFIATNVTATTFELVDIFGTDINTTGYTAYSSGGTGNIVYEIKVPYLEEHLDDIMYDQNADTMYICSRSYETRKLQRTAHDSWTLSRYTRTNDPIATENVTFGTVTGVTQANPGVVSDAGHTFAEGDHVYITGVVGMTELNNRHFTITAPGAGTYSLKDYDTGVAVNTSGYTAYTSGGVVEEIGNNKYPGAVSFTDDSRLCLAGSEGSPETMWYSRQPSAAGAVRFDDFTSGTDDSHAVTFTLAPLQGRVDSIRFMTNTDKYIAAGTFGSLRRIYGDTEQSPIAPEAVTAKSANADGVAIAAPVIEGSVIFYISRSRLTLEAVEYDYQIDGYAPDSKNLISNHITRSGLKVIARTKGRNVYIWAVRNDGVLLCLTYNAKENIAGWSRHPAGGDGVFESIGVFPRENQDDQLWAIIRRTINGNTVRYIEILSDFVEFPFYNDFYTGEDNEDEDRARYFNRLYELQKTATHLDSFLTYDGSAYGTAAGATLTAGTGAVTEDTEDVVFTASAAVFTADMVGRELWGKYDADGNGGGRAEITNFTSSTQVECTIVDSFPANGTVFAAGDWFLTATTMSGLDHLEGETVYCVCDGAVPDTEVVTDGQISIDEPASTIHVGFQYRGIMETLPLDQGGQQGPALNTTKNVARISIRVVDSSLFKFGTSLYDLTEFNPSNEALQTDRPQALITGVDDQVYEDDYSQDKRLYIVQDNPLPSTIAALDVHMVTADE